MDFPDFSFLLNLILLSVQVVELLYAFTDVQFCVHELSFVM